MALPTITNNTPAGGSISWTAFSVAYNGQQYSIAAGNSANKFISWIYNAGAPYMSASDTFPTLADADLLLFLNKGGIGLLVPTADVMDGALVVPGSIYAAAIHADEIQTYHIKANAVTANQIAADAVTATQVLANAIGADEIGANAVYATHITAGAITVDKLTAGTVGDDLVSNGSFEDFDATGFPLGWQTITATNGSMTTVTGVSSSGANAFRLTATTTAANLRARQALAKYIPVSSASGRKWHVSARMGAGTAITQGMYLRVSWFDAVKALISTTDVYANGPVTGTFAVYEGQVTPPSTARYMAVEVMLLSPNVTTSVYVDEVAAREVTVSAMIDDGAITTPKLLAGAVVADKVAARAIGAEKLIAADMTNYWQNSDFEADTVGLLPAGVNPNSNCRVKDISAWAGPVGTGAGNGSARALEIDALNGSNNDVYDTKIYPVTPLDQYYIYYEGRHLNAVGTGVTGVGFRTYNQAKAPITWTNAVSFGTAKTTVMTAKEGVYVVPAGTYFIQPWITFANNAETTNKFIVDNIEIRRMNGGELIVDGAITALKILAGEVKTTHMTTNTIDAGVLKAKTITANKLMLTSTDNLVVEADFGNTGLSWQLGANNTINATAGRGSLPCMRFTGTVSTITSLNLVNKFSVGAEDRFRASFWIKSSATAVSGVYKLVGRCYTTATVYSDITLASNPALSANTWTNVSGISPVLPAGTIAMEVYLSVANAATGTLTDIDYIGLTRAADGSLVVDGAIDGKVITGATIQTAASGSRIVLDQTSLNAWNAVGDNYFNMSSATGVNISSTGQAGSDFSRTNYCTNPSMEVDISGWASSQTIVRDTTQFYSGTASLKATHTATADRVVTRNETYFVNGDQTFSAYVRHNAATAKNVHAEFYWTDNAGTPVAGGTFIGGDVSVPANTWTRVSVGTSAGTPGTAIKLRVAIVGTAFTSTETLWADAALLEKVFNSVTPYFDGATATAGSYSYVWRGTAGLSVSDEKKARDVKIKTGGIDVLAPAATQQPGVGFILPIPYTNTAGLFSDGKIVSLVEGASDPQLTRIDVGNQEVRTWSGGNTYITAQSAVTVSSPNGTVELSAGNAVLINGTSMSSGHVELTNSGFSVSGGNVSWDIGTLTTDTAASTYNYATIAAPGPYSGSVKVLQSGYYSFSCLAQPTTGPGQAMMRIVVGSNTRWVAQYTTTGYYWELYASTAPIYLAANDYVRFVVFYANTATTVSRVWVHKHVF